MHQFRKVVVLVAIFVAIPFLLFMTFATVRDRTESGERSTQEKIEAVSSTAGE